LFAAYIRIAAEDRRDLKLIWKTALLILTGLSIVAGSIVVVLVLVLVASVHNWPAFWSYLVGGDNHGCRAERVVHVDGGMEPNYIVTLSTGRSYQRDVHDTETYGGDCGRGPCRFHPGDTAFVCPTRYRDKGGIELVESPSDMDYPNDFTYHIFAAPPAREAASR
jgi:hypothetical protein